MFNRLFPKEFNFFELFDKQADCLLDGADAFRKALENGHINTPALKRVQEIETTADGHAGRIIGQLNKSFITPFDREDIHALTKALDDVIDMLNTIASRLTTYKITAVRKNLTDSSLVIEASIRALASAVKGMKSTKNFDVIMRSCVEIGRLENISDSMRDTALMDLFENEKDPVLIIKWKEIYEDAETVLDLCEDAAHVVETIMLKQA